MGILATKIWIIIPTHNRKALTLACLQSLSEQTTGGFRIIVIDDGCNDGTSTGIAEVYPEVVVLRGNGNLWWAGAMNAGVRYALNQGAEYVVSLNDDLEVSANYIESMVHWARYYPNALLGSFALDIETSSPDFAGCRLNWRTGKVTSVLDTVCGGDCSGLHPVTHFSGRGLWIPARVFRHIGLFDAKAFPLYAADDDFTLRAAKQGYEIYCNMDARLYSHTSESALRIKSKGRGIRVVWQYLFGIKGKGNLKNFVLISLRHCPKKYLFFYMLKGTAARVVGSLNARS